MVKKKEIDTEQVVSWIHDYEKRMHLGNGETVGVHGGGREVRFEKHVRGKCHRSIKSSLKF